MAPLRNRLYSRGTQELTFNAEPQRAAEEKLLAIRVKPDDDQVIEAGTELRGTEIHDQVTTGLGDEVCPT